MWTRSRVGKAAVKTVAAVGAASLGLFGGVTAASAAPGDSSNASARFLDGTILGAIDTDLLVELAGAQASNDGVGEPVIDFNTLDLTVLGTVNLTAGGGVQIPLNLGSLGVVGQYAQANPDGTSRAVSGAVGSGGVIGTGAAPTGPLSVDLGQAVDTLAGPVAQNLVDEIADVDVTLGAVTAEASLDADAEPVRDYTIAGGQLTIDSTTLSNLTATLNTAVGGLQTSLDGVDTLVNQGVLGLLGGVIDVDVEVDTTSLTGAISETLTGELTSDEYPGVSIDLGNGVITVDLAQIQPLNDLAPGTNILGAAALQRVQLAITDIVSDLVDDLNADLLEAVRGIGIRGEIALPATFLTPRLTLVDIDTTVGALLDDPEAGLVLVGAIPVSLGVVGEALVAPLEALLLDLGGAIDTAVAPVGTVLAPALNEILPRLITITVNNLEDDEAAGVYGITAAIVTVLPGSLATTIELANATVGPNVRDANADVVIVAPEEGEEFFVDGPEDVTDVTVSGTGQTGGTITVTIPGQPTQTAPVVDGAWEVTFEGLPVGDYTATATQNLDGSTDTVDFSVVETPDVVIEAPVDGAIIVVPGADDTADVTVSGSGAPNTDVTVVVGEDEQIVPVNEEGEWTATFPGLPVGEYTATATGEDGSEDSVDFTVSEAPDVVIEEPGEGDEFAIGGPDDETTVTVSGSGSPGATVTVTLDNGDEEQTIVSETGDWSVDFEGLGEGEYTATAEQDIDGSTDTVTFEVVLATPVTIVTPADGTEIEVLEADATTSVTVSGTGQAGAEVEVTLTDGATELTQTATVVEGADGVDTWTVTFTGVGVGSYTATAVQDIDQSTDSVTFTVAATVVDADAEAADIDVPADADAEADLDADGLDLVADTDVDGLDLVADADVDADADGLDLVADADADVDADADGLDLVADADGLDLVADADGLDLVADADGLDLVADADGLDLVADADGLDLVADADGLDLVADADGLDLVADADGLDLVADADGLDLVADADGLDLVADADGLDLVADADGLDLVADADGLDLVADADGLDLVADADGLDLVADADGLDLVADADGLDLVADADGLDLVADADGLDLVADADGLDSLDTLDIADAIDQLDIADAVDQAIDQLDIADAIDQLDIADAIDQLDIADAIDQAIDQLDLADALDQLDADADGMDADADGADATDADGADTDGADTDGADADGADADGADAADADADAADAADTDADGGADAADASDADASDADGTDGGVTTQARADVTQKQIVRGTGVNQTVVVQGFQPGETISATVNSTPFTLIPVTADSSGAARLTFAVNADFELGQHRVEVRGSVTGELPTERENTDFTVVAKKAAMGAGGLPATGSDLNGPLVGGFAAALILAGAALLTVRRRSASGEQR